MADKAKNQKEWGWGLWVLLMAMGVIAAGYLTLGSIIVGYTLAKERLETESVMFQAGYNDGSVQDISDMVLKCAPENVEVFNFIDIRNQKHTGIIYKCLKNNSTKLVKFSQFYRYRELQ